MSNNRTTLISIAAIALVGMLAFLYTKTALDFKQQNRVLSYLRELKDIDARWDAELLRARFEVGRSRLLQRDFADTLRRTFSGLAAEKASSQAIAEGLDALQKAFDEKAERIDKYKARRDELKDALVNLAGASAETQAMLRGALSANSRLSGRIGGLAQLVSQLQAEVLKYNFVPDDRQKAQLDSVLADLHAAEQENSPPLSTALAALGKQAQAVLRLKPEEERQFNGLFFVTAGPRVDTLTTAFSNEIERTLQVQDLFRVCLIVFAGVLLVLLSYAGSRLAHSYQLLNEANAALKTANEQLEQRVKERTRELSDALKRLEESQSMLVQTEKMSSLGQMVAGVAHEINTPLAYVKNSLETVAAELPPLGELAAETEKLLGLLQAGGGNEDQLAEQFARVSERVAALREQQTTTELPKLVKDGQYGIEQIAEIVANLKDFARLDRSKVDKFNIADGIESTLSIAKHLLKTVAVEKHFAKVPSITCSPSQINQVLLNLITNAAQATEGKAGRISITTRAPDAAHVAVDVEDNGKGIPPEVLPKIFDPFFTTKEVGKGTGLGLSIAYKIVEGHGGTIEAQSKVGVGTRFTLTLPLQPPAQQQAA